MGTIFYATTLLVLVHMANTYILLTANLEDVHAIAKQVAASPVAQQINKIIRRATNLFNQQLNQPKDNMHLRAEDSDAGDGDNYSQPERQSRSSENEERGAESDSANRVERRKGSGDDVAALGRNASYYLSSIQKIFQNVQ